MLGRELRAPMIPELLGCSKTADHSNSRVAVAAKEHVGLGVELSFFHRVTGEEGVVNGLDRDVGLEAYRASRG